MHIDNNNNSYSPSYGRLWHSAHTFSKVQKDIIKDISTKLNATKNGQFNNLSPMNWLEKKGYDVFVTSGEHKDSIKMQLVDRIKHPNGGPAKLTPESYVGEYTNTNQFNYNDILQAHKDSIMGGIAILAGALMILGTIIGKTAIDLKMAKQSKIPQNVEHVTKMVTDTIKTFPKDTLLIR